MKPLLLFSFALISYSSLLAQDSTLVTSNNVGDGLTFADKYYYPQFMKGEVFFRGDMKATPKLNYNRLYDQMLFIDPKGDTLAVANEKAIKFIAIQKDTFYFDEGYVRLLEVNGVVKLAEKQTWLVVDIRKTSTHNTSTSTNSITSLRTFREGNDVTRNSLSLNEDIVLRKEIQYYIGDEYNNFNRASKKGVLQLFPKKQRSIEDYLKQNKIDFDKKEEVKKMAEFINSLY